MKLLVDMFACQTGSRFRGIGRYIHSLVKEMVNLTGSNQMVMLANLLYPETYNDLRQEFSPLLPQGSFLPYSNIPINIGLLDHDPNFESACTLGRHTYEMLSPDVALYPSVFEGWGEKGVVPLPSNGLPASTNVAIVYDFIPYRFQSHFLDHDPRFKHAYLNRLESYKDFDLLLAISESTRQDAVQILNFSPDRVVNLSGATSAKFRRIDYPPETIDALFSKLKLTKPYIFYAGNAEFHKNMDGFLRAFSRLPQNIKDEHQIVFTHTGDETVFRNKIRALGLTNDSIVITGHISDDEMVLLYNRCKLFIFPSLYEGFGLPILEAMACGAPVIASNNSSIPEVIGREDAMFDASSEESMTAALYRALTDDTFRQEMSAFGLERVKQFSWAKSAQKAWDAIETAVREKKQQTRVLLEQKSGQKPRIAFVAVGKKNGRINTPGFANLLTHLQAGFEVECFTNADQPPVQPAQENLPKSYPLSELQTRRDGCEAFVYALEDASPEPQIIDLMREFPGVAVLLDWRLMQSTTGVADPENSGGLNPDRKIKQEIANEYGLKGLLEYTRSGLDQAAEPWPLLGPVLKYAKAVVVSTPEQADRLTRFYGNGWMPQVHMIDFIGALPSVGERDGEKFLPRVSDLFREVIIPEIHRDERQLFSPMINDMIALRVSKDSVKLAARLAASNYSLRSQPRLLIDVSNISSWDAGTGIQRVVRNVIREMTAITDPAFRIDLVKIQDGKLFNSYRYAEKLFGLPAESLGDETPVEIRNGDQLFMLDSSWHLYDLFLPVFNQIRSHGGRIFTMIYDLIPILLPETCDKPVLDTFNHWVDTAIAQSDGLICISQAVADDVARYIDRTKGLLTHPLNLDFVHLGSDISPTSGGSIVRDFVENMVESSQAPLFLMVGTIEPRKGHNFAIDAFEELWRRGLDYRLCIIGKVGWNSAQTETRIKTHPEYGRRLFFIEKATDAEINYCYSHATALVSPSIAEGFGLPIIEAAYHDIPAVVSDIPVFHEVGGEGSLYFSLESPIHMAEAVIRMTKLPESERLAMAKRIEILTWKDCAGMVLKIIQNKRKYRRLG